MGKATVQLILLAFCLGLVKAQYPGGYGGQTTGYGFPGNAGNPGYTGSVDYGSNALGNGYAGGINGVNGINSYNPAAAGINGVNSYNPAASGGYAGGLNGVNGINGVNTYNPAASGGFASGSGSPDAAGAAGNPNSRIFGLLSGGGLFGRRGGLLSSLFGGNRFGGGGYPVAYPGFGGYPGYGGGLFG